MKAIIFIFLIPFLIVKFFIWLIISILAIIFGAMGIILNLCSIDDVVDWIGNLWEYYLPNG